MSKRRTLKSAVTVLTAAAGVLAAAAGTANAATGAILRASDNAVTPASITLQKTTVLRDEATHRCLESDTASTTGTNRVYTTTCTGSSPQAWGWYYDTAYGAYELKDGATGMCLDSNSSGSVYALKCNNGTYQRWIMTYDYIDDTYGFRDYTTGLMLDSNASGSVYTNPNYANANQSWYETLGR
ncbi:hypothetical protein GCM10023322_01580 [Rugosimonospora acidiphila]|uniref:Ricin B lectin domain-containing protein n=1 Tax=Rugosimonospora acidiphila TaxID=556531 RepID=A0ABP9RHG8_9ACTN